MIQKDLLEKIGFDAEQMADYRRYRSLIGGSVEPISRAFMREGLAFDEARKQVATMVTEALPAETLDLFFLLDATGYLFEDYMAAGLPESLFFDTVTDLKYKTDECRRVRGTFGNFVAFWYEGFYKMTRFALGRLQYDIRPYGGEAVTIGGHTVAPGDFALNCHIPSSGPLVYEAVLDSYRRAYDFFGDRLKSGVLPIYCNSWLLYPPYLEQVFEENSNIRRFASDYTHLCDETYDVFHPAWRIYGREYGGDTSVLPRQTRLQQNFIKYLESGGSFGSSAGILVFDGERVLH